MVKTVPDRLFAMQSAAALGSLVETVEASASPEAMRGLAELIAQAEAGRALAANMAAMITDLFGGANPRKVAEAARGALAFYGVTKGLGPGAEMLKKMQKSPEG